MTRKNEAYWEGYREQEARTAAKAARAAVDAMPNFADLAGTVARQLGRDYAHKQRILATSPYLASAFDAEDLGSMSASELARYELKSLGINCSDNSDPLEIRDAYHAGRMRERQIKHNPATANSAMRSAQDGAGDSFIDDYITGKE
jgi:hypothetical protein